MKIKKHIVLVLISVFTLFACQENQIHGIYYVDKESKIVVFEENTVIIYDLIDSTEMRYGFSNNDKSIILKSGQEHFSIDFDKSKSGLKLNDRDSKLTNRSDELYLNKIEFENQQQFFNAFWGVNIPNSNSVYLFCLLPNANTGLEYTSAQNHSNLDEFYFDSRFHYNSYVFFNRFPIFQIQNGVFANESFLIDQVNADHLIMRSIDTNQFLEFKRYDFPIITCPMYLPGAVKLDGFVEEGI
jgi:hypothetical protein